jgi:hypothetical protein
MSIDTLLSEILHTPRGNTMRTFRLSLLRRNNRILETGRIEPLTKKLFNWMWDYAPDPADPHQDNDEFDQDSCEIESEFFGAIWALEYIMDHGLPTDLKEIIEGMKD